MDARRLTANQATEGATGADDRLALTSALTRAEAALQLSAGLMHDVRNALLVVLGSSDLLAHDRLDERQAECVRDIQQAASHAVAILGDFVALSRPPAATTAVVDSATLAGRLRPMVRQVARSRVECAVDIAPSVWPVAAEAHQLEAVLINLCANARDAMPDGGRLEVAARNVAAGSAELAGLAAGDHVAFAVRDTGGGMPPEVLDRATEAFFTTKAEQGGTGLGLAMAQAFATRHGGTLRISSVVGRGTTVELLLPSAMPPPATDATRAPREAVVQTIRAQVRTPWLRDVLDAWVRACGPAALPNPLDVDLAVAPYAERSLVVLVNPDEPGGRLRLLRIGRALQHALDTAGGGEIGMASALAGSLGDTYRRTAASAVPRYERARYSFGDEPVAGFERLIMPASLDGQRVSHVIGVVAFSDIVDS